MKAFTVGSAIRIVALCAFFALAPTAMAADPEIETLRDCDLCPEMVVVPAGEFAMGADGGEEGRYEGPVRQVSVPSFALANTELTHGAYRRFVAATGYRSDGDADCRVWPDERMAAGSFSWRDPGYGMPPPDDFPVACISWNDAVAYTDWLAALTGKPYRLPTEAEWEYAARAGTDTPFFWGADEAAGCEFANMNDAAAVDQNFPWAAASCDDGHGVAAPVGSYKPNPFGLQDMLGNVWEWVQDCYVLPYPATPVDGSAIKAEGACERRGVRGGSWITRPDRHRVTFRGRDPEDTVFHMFGVRLARDLVPDEINP